MNGCPWETVRAIIDTGLAAAAGDESARVRLEGWSLSLPASRIAHRRVFEPAEFVPPAVTVTRGEREVWTDTEWLEAA